MQSDSIGVNIPPQGRDHAAFASWQGSQFGQRLSRYECHRPEQILLYQLVEKHYRVFESQRAVEGRVLRDKVRREFNE